MVSNVNAGNQNPPPPHFQVLGGGGVTGYLFFHYSLPVKREPAIIVDMVNMELAERQILLKDKKSKSWFAYVGPILSWYNLPSTVDLLNTKISKEAWKQTVDKHVNAYWVDKIKLEANKKIVTQIFEYSKLQIW